MMIALKEVARLQLRKPSNNLLHLLGCCSPILDAADIQLKQQPVQCQKQSRFFSGGRHISGSDFLCSNKARVRLRNLEVSTQDFMRHDSPSASPELDCFFEAAQEAADKNYNMEGLKEIYYRLVRSELLSRLLIHNFPFNDSCTHWLNYQTHARTKATTRFTTSYDVMCVLMGLPKEHWVLYLNYLAEDRIAVIEEWVSISSTSHLMYDHGLKDFGGFHFHKGEADASWHKHSNTADLSTLIWDGQQVISSNTYLGVPNCTSIINSEGKGVLALLKEAKDMGLDHFVLWTDSEKIGEVISGKRHVDQNDQDWKLYMALRSMRTSFKHLVVRCVPREIMKFTDGMLREPDVQLAKETAVKYPRTVIQSAKPWAYHLNGLPVFRLSMTRRAKDTMSRFGKPVDGEPSSNKFYVEVEESQKLSAVHNLSSVLNPPKLYVAIKENDKRPDNVIRELYDLIGNPVVLNVPNWSLLTEESAGVDPKGTVLIVFDGWCLEKGLPQADFVVLLSAPENRVSLTSMGFKELSASAYITYHGACTPT